MDYTATVRSLLTDIKDRYQPDWGGDNEGCWADAEDATAALKLMDESAPQCLDNPPNCSHRLVPDPL